jgi:ElaB/YqjD/DUF883 family membrane-anchored ribosome-binding protein
VDTYIARELAALRGEIELLRSNADREETTYAAANAPGEKRPAGPEWSALKDEIKELNSAIEDVIKEAGAGISRRVLARIATAFAFGLLVGRLISRRARVSNAEHVR